MGELTLTATVDESHMIHLELPPEMTGEVEIVVRERGPGGSSAALWRAVRDAPRSDDPTIWQRAREELDLGRDQA